jgi:formate dehydrogenase subunit gamma
MKSKIIFLSILLILAVTVSCVFAEANSPSPSPMLSSSVVLGVPLDNRVQTYDKITAEYVGDWKKYGQTFTFLQKTYFKKIYFLILLAIPVVFILHYIFIGPKQFAHSGEQVLVFTKLNRIIHWVTAISFLLLVLSGVIMIFGKYFGGGAFVRAVRYTHAPVALIFTPFGLIMFFMWLRDMLLESGDITWFMKFGGYLSKKDETMPVGKFNPGQKIWFWLGTLGGFIMAYTGYYMFYFSTGVDNLRICAITHNILGMTLVAMFLVHLYMSLFAIKGSLISMLTGYKGEHELKVMHYKYYQKVRGKECTN